MEKLKNKKKKAKGKINKMNLKRNSRVVRSWLIKKKTPSFQLLPAKRAIKNLRLRKTKVRIVMLTLWT